MHDKHKGTMNVGIAAQILYTLAPSSRGSVSSEPSAAIYTSEQPCPPGQAGLRDGSELKSLGIPDIQSTSSSELSRR